MSSSKALTKSLVVLGKVSLNQVQKVNGEHGEQWLRAFYVVNQTVLGSVMYPF
jgi:hypothetical protein